MHTHTHTDVCLFRRTTTSARDTRLKICAGIPGARRVYRTKYTIYKIYNIHVRVNVDIVSRCWLGQYTYMLVRSSWVARVSKQQISIRITNG